MLVNLAEDEGEQRDLAGQFPDRVKKLQVRWDEWDRQLKVPSWPDARLRQPARP
jgi:hypothetical protein